VFASDTLAALQDSMIQTPTALALVYLPQGGAYPTLNLTDRFGCLVVMRAVATVRAWMVPVPTEAGCDVTFSTAQLSTANRISAKSPQQSKSPIPPVARWDWDDSTQTQFIGVKCGDSWCEFGQRAGFATRPPYATGTPAPLNVPSYGVKGAFDEQRLAEWNTGVLVAATNRATIVPTPELQSITDTGPTPGNWVRVARAHIGPAEGTYRNQLNVIASVVAEGATGVSTMYLCRSMTDECMPAEPLKKFDLSGCTRGADNAYWVARVAQAGDSKYYCVLQRRHDPAFVVPAVVRWRWRANDETVWVSCSRGCCEVKAH